MSISRNLCDSIAKQLGNSIPALKFDPVELIAASNELFEGLRGSLPNTISGRRDAANLYVRRLPKNEHEAMQRVKTDASTALREPEVLSLWKQEVEAVKKLEAVESELHRIRQEPLNRQLNVIRKAQLSEQHDKLEDAWDIKKLDSIEAAAKSRIFALLGKSSADPFNRRSQVGIALQTIQNVRILKELAKER